MLDQAQKKNNKNLATAKQLIRKNSACSWKIRQFFSQSERKDRLDPSNQKNLFYVVIRKYYAQLILCITVNPFMLNFKNDQTYFKNLAVFTPQLYLASFQHYTGKS